MATTKKTSKSTAKSKSSKKKEENVSINDIFKTEEPKITIDPDTGEIKQVFEEDESELFEKQLWGKNPKRTQALCDLWFNDIQDALKKSKKTGEARDHLLMSMVVNATLDLVMEATPEELGMDVSFPLDTYIGMLLVNRKYGVDISGEMEKAISIVKREDYDTDDDFARAVEDINNHWWSLGQPKLDMRNPSDAITEMLIKYGLND